MTFFIAIAIACDAINNDDNTNAMRLPTISASAAINESVVYWILILSLNRYYCFHYSE